MTDIKFVYFDLGNIFVSFDTSVACANLARLYGTTDDAIRSVVYGAGLGDRYEVGEYTNEQYKRVVENQLGADSGVALSEFLDAVGDMFEPVESMQAIMQKVRATGIPAGILSNTCFAHWNWVQRQKWPALDGPFDPVILSYEAKSMKPDGGIYMAAEIAIKKTLNIDPPALLFLDDRQENIDVAIARGWNAAQCFGGPELEKRLQEFGVLA